MFQGHPAVQGFFQKSYVIFSQVPFLLPNIAPKCWDIMDAGNQPGKGLSMKERIVCFSLAHLVDNYCDITIEGVGAGA